MMDDRQSRHSPSPRLDRQSSLLSQRILVSMCMVALLCLIQLSTNRPLAQTPVAGDIDLQSQRRAQSKLEDDIEAHSNSSKQQQSLATHSLPATLIVHQAYDQVFQHLTWCTEGVDMQKCFDETYRRNSLVSNVPWWFQTMLRDARITNTMWHHLSAHDMVDNQGLHFCTMEKIGSTQWRRVFCLLTNQTFDGRPCYPETDVPDTAPKAVFLRDPLERFLSAYMDKCLDPKKLFQKHCEPGSVFLEEENHGLTKGIKDDKKLLFEAYADAMPFKWNVHFFPQSIYCDGLFRQLSSYDFVGRMGPSFYDDLDRMGSRYGERMMAGLEQAFRLNQTRDESKMRASSHVLEYYTPKSVRRVLEYMAMDYVSLKMPIPEWAEEMLKQDSFVATSE